MTQAPPRLRTCTIHKNIIDMEQLDDYGMSHLCAGRNDAADVAASLQAGRLVSMPHPDTIADGLKVTGGPSKCVAPDAMFC